MWWILTPWQTYEDISLFNFSMFYCVRIRMNDVECRTTTVMQHPALIISMLFTEECNYKSEWPLFSNYHDKYVGIWGKIIILFHIQFPNTIRSNNYRLVYFGRGTTCKFNSSTIIPDTLPIYERLQHLLPNLLYLICHSIGANIQNESCLRWTYSECKKFPNKKPYAG